MMSGEFFLLLSTGLLTGCSHCVGMCGPLVSAFAVGHRSAGRQVTTPLLLYQTGRLTTYLLLGAILGALGALAEVLSAMKGWQGGFSVTLGLLLVLTALHLLGLLPCRQWLASTALARLATGCVRRWLSAGHPAAPLALGLANGLLPCGPLYAMALLAASSGNAVKGASIMLLFGLGTLPALLAVGFSAVRLSAGVRRHLYRLAAALVLFVGVQLILRGLARYGLAPHAALVGVMLW